MKRNITNLVLHFTISNTYFQLEKVLVIYGITEYIFQMKTYNKLDMSNVLILISSKSILLFPWELKYFT